MRTRRRWLGWMAVALLAGLSACASGARSGGADRAAFAMSAAYEGVVADDAGAQYAERKIIRSADLTLEVDDADAAGREITRIATESGGFILSSSRTRYRLKVPATGLDSAVEFVETLGEVTHKRLTGEDVTAEYVDLEVRLANAHAAREAYEKLLAQATTVQDVLEIEKALSEVQERIELLQGRRKFLDEHLALSSLDVTLREVETPGPLKLVWQGVAWIADLLW